MKSEEQNFKYFKYFACYIFSRTLDGWNITEPWPQFDFVVWFKMELSVKQR